ncbi:hypothetical protein F4680DRAFT_231755 [Xylaria scruposa]|nr:hypothetical protein F4680DRAFT_231755 [Xylaria scruposa]
MLQQFRGQTSRDDSVAFPESTLGLNLLTSPSTNRDADVDIVAVHGLGGDSCSTWKGKNGKVWLKDFLPAQVENPPDEFCTGDNDGRKVRVMTFGYDSNIFAKAAKVRSMHFAEKLLSSLSDRRTGGAQGRPLMFIGHSLGGIVIKKALNFAKMRPELYGDILRSVVHVCFFGTPHQGTSSLASLLRGLGSALTRGKDGSIIKELELWSAPLQETNQFFIGVRDNFSITSFWETEKYCGVKVVEEGSATLGAKYEKRIPLDKDHINMCKFESVQDPAYRDVFSRLYNEIVNIGTPTQVREQEERIKRLLESVPPTPDTSVSSVA